MKYIWNAIVHCGNFDVPCRSPFGIPCAAPYRTGGTLLASSPFPVLYIKVSHAVCPGTILALFARGADRRSGNRRLRRTDPLSGGTDGGRDDLCPAARADVPIDRAARLAAQCGGLAAAGRGGVLLPGADLAAGLDGCRARAASYARSPPACRLGPTPRGAGPGAYGLRPVAGEQPAEPALGASAPWAVAPRRGDGLCGQCGGPALRALLHAAGWPPHGGVHPRAAPLQPRGGERRPARGSHDR